MSNFDMQRCFQGLAEKFLPIIPKEDRKSFNRIGFHVEAAWWFYNDFCRPAAPSLPNMNLRHFANCVLAFQPALLKPFGGLGNIEKLLDGFFAYRSQIPVCGAAIFDRSRQRLLLVRGLHSSAKWSFPRGKMSAHESAAACAIREVYEETGYDISPLVDEQRKLEWIKPGLHPIRIYIVTLPAGDEKFPFEPKTMGEIGQIGWHRLESLKQQPKLYYDVAQFIKDLLLFGSTTAAFFQTSPQLYREQHLERAKSKRVPLTELFPPETSGPFAEHADDLSAKRQDDPAAYAHEMADQLLLADWFPKSSPRVTSVDAREAQHLKSLLMQSRGEASDLEDKVAVTPVEASELAADLAPKLIFSDLLEPASGEHDELLDLLLKK
jgi:mRNA-decapping enzyme subunit 2